MDGGPGLSSAGMEPATASTLHGRKVDFVYFTVENIRQHLSSAECNVQ